MCTNALQEISNQQRDKAIIRLSERFLRPDELLERYREFYANAGTLIKPCAISNDIDTLTKDFFRKRKEDFDSALIKMNTVFSYDPEEKILTVKWNKSPCEHSIDYGSYILDIGKDGSVIGIELFNVVL